MKQLTVYECPFCKKLFRTANRHQCRRNPVHKNCYSCIHWGHQFAFDNSYDGSGYVTCGSKEACKINSPSEEEAFEIMRTNGWSLACEDWQRRVVENPRKVVRYHASPAQRIKGR